MKIFFLVLAVSVFLITPASAQEKSNLFTRPALPPAESLDRLNLKLAWYKQVPTEGIKDGIATFQYLPDKDGDEILIQTRSGLVQFMDAETGDLKWRTRVGLPYKLTHGAAFNTHSIFVMRDARLFVLDRETGRHRLFHVDRLTGQLEMGMLLSKAPSTDLIADEVALFIPSDNRIGAYLMPDYTTEEVTLPSPLPGELLPPFKGPFPPPPKHQGDFAITGTGVTKPLLMHQEFLGFFANDGTFFSINKYKLAYDSHFKTFGLALTGPSHYGKWVYLGSPDFSVYAVDIHSGQLRWRYLSGSPVTRTPLPTDKDLFVTSVKRGLHRLDREEGDLIWNNPKAEMFLATNNKFVYALDSQRFLLVLDYLKGTTLSRLDLSQFVVPFSNTHTDRVYFANHDGKVICLRHTNFQKAYRPTTVENGEAPPPDNGAMPPAQPVPNGKDD